MSESFEQILTSDRNHHFLLLDSILPNPPAIKKEQDKIIEAMRYSLLAGGKLIRGGLVYATARSLGDVSVDHHRVACAIEAIHCFSLIHDDLPAMDDDSIRRNQPSNHIQFGEATAILAGDALQAFAYEIINSQSYPDLFPQACNHTAALTTILAQACGRQGMIQGQMFDLALSTSRIKVTLQELKLMHLAKTGALFAACSHMAGICSGIKDIALLKLLANIALSFGLCYQIRDDILDVIGSENIGRPVGSDSRNEKATFVSVLGLDRAHDQLDDEKIHLDELITELSFNKGFVSEQSAYLKWFTSHFLQL